MAQLISPVCTDTLKLQNPTRTLFSRSRWRMLSRNTSLRWRMFIKYEQARMRMMKQKGPDKTESHWSNLWGHAKKYENTDEEVKERAKRVAAAARRWREYSRRGVDKRPTFKLPEAISNKEN